MRPRYPLQSLERVLEQRIGEQRVELAAEAERVDETTHTREQRQREFSHEQQHFGSTLASEHGRLARGEARAHDLEQLAGFVEGARERQAERDCNLQSALASERAAAAAENIARDQLAELEGESSALKRHRQRFEHEFAKAQEEEQDEQAQEVHTHRSRRVPR